MARTMGGSRAVNAGRCRAPECVAAKTEAGTSLVLQNLVSCFPGQQIAAQRQPPGSRTWRLDLGYPCQTGGLHPVNAALQRMASQPQAWTEGAWWLREGARSRLSSGRPKRKTKSWWSPFRWWSAGLGGRSWKLWAAPGCGHAADHSRGSSAGGRAGVPRARAGRGTVANGYLKSTSGASRVARDMVINRYNPLSLI